MKTDDRRLRQLRRLTEVSRAITSMVSLPEMLRLTVDRAAGLLDAQRAVLLLPEEDGALGIRAARGVDLATGRAFRPALDETLGRHLQTLFGVADDGFVAVPLVTNEEITGVLAVALEPGQARDEEHEWLLSAVADQAAVALEKSRQDEAAQFRERVIGIVSHDLRNPISAISYAAEVLTMRDDVDERTQLLAARIRTSAARAARMIVDLLDYTQSRQSGGIPIARARCDLLSIVRQTVEEVRFAFPNRRIELVAAGVCDGTWDHDRLAQVVTNLLSNALTYSPPHAAVRVELSGENGTVRLVVHNDGPPIPRDRLETIFEPMQRATHETNGNGHALRSVGLGLYIVHSIVTAHGGTVGVRSSSEAGTRFEVRLPRNAA